MTVCNMAIEAGARAGLIAVDDVTGDYYRGRPYAPKGGDWYMAERLWCNLHSDKDAVFDKVIDLDAAAVKPHRPTAQGTAGENRPAPPHMSRRT